MWYARDVQYELRARFSQWRSLGEQHCKLKNHPVSSITNSHFISITDALNLANNWVPIFIFYFSRLLVLCLTCWMLTNHIHDAATTSILHFRCTLFETYLLHVRKVNCIRLCYYWLIPNFNRLFLQVFYQKLENKKYLTNCACFFKLT